MAGQRGLPPKGFAPGPQGQYQTATPPDASWNSQPAGAGGGAGALGGGGRLGIGSNAGTDPMAGRGSLGSLGGVAGSPTFPQGTGGAGAFPPNPGGVPPGGFPATAPIGGGSSMMAAMPDTTTATHVPPEPYMDAAQMAESANPYATGGPLTKLPTGGYGGVGPTGKPMTFGKVMPGSGGPGPLRR